MGEYSGREPCPARILDDIGGAFCMGAVCGGIWHAGKGFRNAPTGWKNRFQFSIDAVKARGPVLGGSFAVWGALFASFDCSFAAVRRKEDPWNSIMSGAATGALLAARAGPKAAGKNALIGGILLAGIEGLGIMITKMSAPPIPTAEDMQQQNMQDPLAPPTMAPSFGNVSVSDLFGSSSETEDVDTTSVSSDPFYSSPETNAFSMAGGEGTLGAEPPQKKSWYNPF